MWKRAQVWWLTDQTRKEEKEDTDGTNQNGFYTGMKQSMNKCNERVLNFLRLKESDSKLHGYKPN